ncbi:hypothetical protein OB955_23955 [Halobacteria archaeon AArc-m2/3/4]|uniref:Uncharacterized protein n=1 Tax=Natronoglomus mannanivorans TaxID=2979990 RepID=A0AAP2Z3B9_9EURY|nr:hypothetical protein [Halobacteria archaeon AArc-xg1-1]MCU4975741.1 hypothetical protein [Halobacteria archaeon AArc-m2/3/4]
MNSMAFNMGCPGRLEALEMMDELTSESELTERDVQEIADRINERERKRIEEESA